MPAATVAISREDAISTFGENGGTAMLGKVEHALNMMRIYLVERVVRDDWGDDRVEELSQTIVTCLEKNAEEPRPETLGRDAKLGTQALRRAIRYVNANLDSKLRWHEISQAVGLNPFRFARGFKLTAGMTPHQYIIRCRLRQAMRLLVRREMSLADVALEVGCSCQSHLTTLFRKHLGTTPGAFRESAQSQPASVRLFAKPSARKPYSTRTSIEPERSRHE